MQDIRVTAVVMQSAFGKADVNLRRMEAHVREAASQRTDIVCFPEMNITGYAIDPAIREHAEPIPGPSADAVAAMAGRYGVLILAGLAEKTAHGVAISHIVAGPTGLVGVYRKVQLSPKEAELYKAGDSLPVFRLPKACIGVQLCYDGHFPEVSLHLASQGAEVLFVAHASPCSETSQQKRDRWLRYLAARAYDNSAYLLACNPVGDGGHKLEYPGVALVLSPRGEVVAETISDRETLLTADLGAEGLAKVRSSRIGYFLGSRRPELYTAPAAGSGAENPVESRTGVVAP